MSLWPLDPSGSGSARTAGTPRLVTTVSFVGWAQLKEKDESDNSAIHETDIVKANLFFIGFCLLQPTN
jgi:hypothetical protein